MILKINGEVVNQCVEATTSEHTLTEIMSHVWFYDYLEQLVEMAMG
jgi:hypothetical protein